MEYYATKLTIDRFRLPQQESAKPDEVDELFQWGLKVFYFEKKKCLQILNFASKLTVFLYDVKVKDTENIPELLQRNLWPLFEQDEEIHSALKWFLGQLNPAVYAPLQNRSIVSSLNYNQTYYLMDGAELLQYLEDGKPNMTELNAAYNFRFLVGKKINGKTDYIVPAEEFKKLLMEKYSSEAAK